MVRFTSNTRRYIELHNLIIFTWTTTQDKDGCVEMKRTDIIKWYH